MNIDILNIGHYRISNHGGRYFDLFNRESDDVYSITADEFKCIKEHNSLEAVSWVEGDAKRREKRKDIGLDVA